MGYFGTSLYRQNRVAKFRQVELDGVCEGATESDLLHSDACPLSPVRDELVFVLAICRPGNKSNAQHEQNIHTPDWRRNNKAGRQARRQAREHASAGFTCMEVLVARCCRHPGAEGLSRAEGSQSLI